MKQHTLAFVIACIVGLVSVLPYVLPVLAIGSDYQGIPFLFQDNEEVYLSRINEVLEGNTWISSPYFFEYKDVPQAQQPMGEWIYALLLYLCIPLISLKFFLPAFLFLLIYFLVWRVHPKSHAAIFIAVLSTLGFDMIRPSYIQSILNGEFHLSIWTRLVNPITGGLFLFGFLHLLLSIFEKPRKVYTVGAGLLLGLMTGYYFSFILACCVLGIVMLWALYRKEYVYVYHALSIFVIGFVVNIHYAWNLFTLDNAVAFKSGMIATHAFMANKIQLLYALVLLGTYRREKIWYIALILFFASVCALNIHVITGAAIWPAHFVQYTNLFAFVGIGILLSRWLDRVYVVGIVGIILLSIFSIRGYEHKIDVFRDIQQRAPVFTWLNEYAPQDCVVLAYEPRAYLTWAIPAFTKCNSYHSPYVFSSVPDERIMHNFLTMLSMRRDGIFTMDDMREYFFRDWRDLFFHQGDGWLQRITDESEVKEFYTDLEKEIKEKQKTFDFDKDIKKYRIDYIMSEGEVPRSNIVTKIYESHGVSLYKVNH